MLPTNEEKTFIETFIDSSITCLLSSIDENNYPQTRAVLGIRNREDITTLYFSTNTSSQKTQQYKNNNKACVYFYDPNKFVWIMFIWEMEVSQETTKKEKVWKDWDETYYPKGFNDDDFSVLIFKTKKIRWDNNLHIKEFIFN